MILLLPPRIASELAEALEQAGPREIGGVLMGEHVADDTFRVMQITIQRTGGTFAAFVRFVEEIVRPLRSFFRSTGHQYTRFNYLGEWHSHHSFDLVPSRRDHETMRQIISDPDLGARFVVLMLTRLRESGVLEQRVTVYRPGLDRSVGKVIQEQGI